MATEKQIKANRLNGQLGGVKTLEGKAVSSCNAVTHGFFSQKLIMPGEDPSLLDTLREKYLNELHPEGEMEVLLVERIISSAWRLKRLVDFERERHERLTHPKPFGNFIPVAQDYGDFEWQDLMRFENSLVRGIYQAMHELERLPRNRRGKFLKLDEKVFGRVPDITPIENGE
jgi:hypothetical protein